MKKLLFITIIILGFPNNIYAKDNDIWEDGIQQAQQQINKETYLSERRTAMQQAQRQAQYNADMQTVNQINQMNQNQQMMNNNLLMQNMSSQPYVQPINPSSNNIIHCIGTAPNLDVCR